MDAAWPAYASLDRPGEHPAGGKSQRGRVARGACRPAQAESRKFSVELALADVAAFDDQQRSQEGSRACIPVLAAFHLLLRVVRGDVRYVCRWRPWRRHGPRKAERPDERFGHGWDAEGCAGPARGRGGAHPTRCAASGAHQAHHIRNEPGSNASSPRVARRGCFQRGYRHGKQWTCPGCTSDGRWPAAGVRRNARVPSEAAEPTAIWPAANAGLRWRRVW